MVRPSHFGFNPETSASNAFQRNKDIAQASEKAIVEFDAMTQKLRDCGIEIWDFPDRDDVICPDAVFPNNWLAVLPDNRIALFPMQAESRRHEVNPGLIATLKQRLGISKVFDFTEEANNGRYLEGTGSIVFDHDQKWAYACESSRTNLGLLSEFCRQIGYEPISFEATDAGGKQIYHTNVMMSVGQNLVLVCLESIGNAIERSMLKERIRMSAKAMLEISMVQMDSFAGNALQVQTGDGLCWILSETAWSSLRDDQKQQLESDGDVCVVEISTIEQLGGGSARCMMAGIF